MLAFLRLILFLSGLFGIYMGIDGLWVQATSHGTPTVVSLKDIVANPKAKLPRFLDIKDAFGSIYVCTYEFAGSDKCREMKVPLLTMDQTMSLVDGKQVTAAIIYKTDDALTKKCNSQPDCLDGVEFKGVSQGSLVNDLDDKDKQILRDKNIVIDDNTVFVDMDATPQSIGFNIFEILFSAFVAFAVVRFWPKKKAVEEV